jgi:hypothetical protein
MNAERPGENGSSRTDRFDFERLERSIEYLLKDHERLSAERAALVEELIEREQRIASREAKLAAEGLRRATAVESVDRILDRLETLEAGLVEAGAEGRR